MYLKEFSEVDHIDQLCVYFAQRHRAFVFQWQGLGGFWGPQSTKVNISIIAHGETVFLVAVRFGKVPTSSA